jgi:hypothetical protein
MAVTHDARQRELVTCDGCGVLHRQWHRLVLSSDGSVLFDVQVCRGCQSHAEDALKLVWKALATKR